MTNDEHTYTHFEPEIMSNRRYRIIRLLNYSVIVALLGYALMYALIDLHVLYPLVIVLGISIVPSIISLYLNEKRQYTVAGVLLCYGLSISLFITCLMVGGSPAFHHFFLLYAIVSLVTAPLKQWFYLSTMVVTNIVFFVFIEFFYQPIQPYIQFPEEYILHFNNSILLLIFLTIAVVLFHYKSITEHFESMVKDQTSKLYTMNKELGQQAMNLNELNTELEERQQQIEEQSEVLKNQKESLEETNQQLEKLVATKDKFFSIIAHDLKNPIGGIMGFASLLEKNTESIDSEKSRLYVQHISESAKKTYELLEDLLAWARSQNSQLHFNPEKMVLNKLIETNAQLLSEHAGEKMLKINLQYDEAVFTGFGDRNMIDTVVRNLMSNAIKFTSPGGEISIGMEHIDDHDQQMVQVSVADTGIGITSDQLGHLFRIDRSSSTKGTAGETGSGLGLILCKEFVEKNGGTLTVKSEQGKGSVFSFTLPVGDHVENGGSF